MFRDDGTRDVQHAASGCVAFADQLFFAGVIAEMADQVRLPIHGAIAQVRRIQRGFFVGIFRVLLAKIVEGDSGRIERNGFGKETRLMFGEGFQQRRQFDGGVLARGEGALDHQLGLLDYLAAGIAHQKLIGGKCDQDGAGAEQGD